MRNPACPLSRYRFPRLTICVLPTATSPIDVLFCSTLPVSTTSEAGSNTRIPAKPLSLKRLLVNVQSSAHKIAILYPLTAIPSSSVPLRAPPTRSPRGRPSSMASVFAASSSSLSNKQCLQPPQPHVSCRATGSSHVG